MSRHRERTERRRPRTPARAVLAAGLIGLSLGTAAARPQRPGAFTLVYPGRPWSLHLSLPGFRMERRPFEASRPALVATGRHRATGLRLTIVMEPAAREGDARDCRKHYWRRARRSPIAKTDVLLSERDDMAIVEYMAQEYGGVALRRKNVNAYLARDGIWIAIHLSKNDYRDEDRERFERVLDSVRLRERRRR